MSVAIMDVTTICFAIALYSKILAVLAILFTALLGPYLMYYFMLENNVIAMYPIYDELREMVLGMDEDKK